MGSSTNTRSRITIIIALLAIAGCVFVLRPLLDSGDNPDSAPTNETTTVAALSELLGAESDRENEQEERVLVTEATYTPTPAGICEAVRDGKLDAVKAILAERPDLLTATNPYNWASLPEMRVHPWAKYPVEIAVVFGHADIVD